jgi:hypothetical protein
MDAADDYRPYENMFSRLSETDECILASAAPILRRLHMQGAKLDRKVVLLPAECTSQKSIELTGGPSVSAFYHAVQTGELYDTSQHQEACAPAPLDEGRRALRKRDSVTNLVAPPMAPTPANCLPPGEGVDGEAWHKGIVFASAMDKVVTGRSNPMTASMGVCGNSFRCCLLHSFAVC